MPIDPFFTSQVRLKHSTWDCKRQTLKGGKKYVEALYEGKEIKPRRKKRRRR
jgi:hypothetical protein